MSQIREKYLQLEHLGSRIKKMNDMVWEGHSSQFEDITHTLGGVGLGFLIYSPFAKWARPIGYTLVGLSALLHIYALMTARPKSRVEEVMDRLRVGAETAITKVKEAGTRAA